MESNKHCHSKTPTASHHRTKHHSKPGLQTYVECPNENHVPTVTGRCPLAINLLVIRSIAYTPEPMSTSTHSSKSAKLTEI